MVYRALGVLFSHSGLAISFTEFHENAGKWTFELKRDKTYRAQTVHSTVQDFIEENDLQYQVALITVHSETPELIFDGASIAASTGLPVITHLSELDRVLGGNGEFYETCLEKLGIAERNINDVNKSMCIAFMGVLRWREEYNFLSSTTGAARSSIGGAIWLGQEA